MYSIFLVTSVSSSKFRYFDLPLGSPIKPVAPPTKKIGFSPIRLSRLIIMIDTKLPKFTCKYLNEVSLK